MKRLLIVFIVLAPLFMLSAEKLEIEKPLLGKLIERNGFLYDTFYYHMNGEPQYLLQKYDEIAIPHSVNLNSFHGLEFNGIRITDLISDVTFDAKNFRAFKINLNEFDRKNWIQIRNILAKNNIPVWPVLTYHAKDTPIVLDGSMNLVFMKYTSKEEQEETLRIFGLKVIEIVDEENGFYTVQIPTGADPFAIANALYTRHLVRWAQPNWLWKFVPMSTTPNDTYFSKQWHLTQINAPEAWDTETAAGKDVRIAIVDTGVDLNHPDLNVLSNLGKDYVGSLGGAPNTEQNGNDHEGVPHGTASAGLAAAKTNNEMGISATCWGCPIIPIRLIADAGTSYSAVNASDNYNSMKYAVDNGAWVINNGWGTQDVDLHSGNCISVPADNNSSQGVDYGKTNGRNGKGTIFLWAAGNSHCNTNLNSFLKDNDFLTVSAVGASSAFESYSNYGNEIDIAAGAGNNTTDIQGNNYGYACSSYNCLGSLDSGTGNYTSGFSGTSAATPVAAGAVALMLAANPDLTFSGAMNCIKVSARKPSTNCSEGEWTMQDDEWIEGGSKEHSPCFGFGIVDANAMVVEAKNGTCGACIATSKIDRCFGNYYDRDDDCDGTVDNDCTNGGKGKAGDTCSTASDCINAAENPKCITGEDWPGGYCSAECDKNADCYNGGSKVECYQGQCIAKCTYNEVRSGYQCISGKILPEGTGVTASCGNDIKEEGEECDGDYKSCQEIDNNFTDGNAYCKSTCTGYDTSTCSGGSDDPDTADTTDTADSGDNPDSSDKTDTADSEDDKIDTEADTDSGSESSDTAESESGNSENANPGIGELHGECRSDRTCNAGLVCNSHNICKEEIKFSGCSALVF